MTSPGRSRPGVWWLSPAGVVLLVVPVTLALAVGYSDEDFRTYFRTPKSLTGSSAMLFGTGALLLVAGALAVQQGRRPAAPRGRWPDLGEKELVALRRLVTPLYAATLVGYASFVVAGAIHDVSLLDVWNAVVRQNVASGRLEETIGTLPGFTTLTQVGVAYALVATLLLMHRWEWLLAAQLALLLALTVARSYILTERLAVIEVVLPVLALVALRLSQSPGPRRRVLVQFAPLPLVLLLVVGFAASEYSRSYNFYKNRTDDSLLVFSTKRLSGYYATAYNNGQLLLTHDDAPNRLPYSTLEAVWTAPGVQDLNVYDRLVDRERSSGYRNILFGYGNPEFNNPGGLAAPFVDFGRGGGLVVFLGLGAAVGWAHRGFVEGRLHALLLYPVSVTGLFELPRFLYWSLGRTAPVFAALLLVAWVVRRATRYRPTVQP